MRIHSHVCAGSRRYEDVDVDDVSDIDISITDTITVDDGPVGRSEAHHLSDEIAFPLLPLAANVRHSSSLLPSSTSLISRHPSRCVCRTPRHPAGSQSYQPLTTHRRAHYHAQWSRALFPPITEVSVPPSFTLGGALSI